VNSVKKGSNSMDMRKGKIGFASISHVDYINGIVDEQSKIAIRNIEEAGYEVVPCPEPAVDYVTASNAGAFLASQRLDGVVIFLASWLECPSFMSVYREVEHLPVCVQGFPMCMYQGKQESTGSYVSYTMIKGTLDRLGRSWHGILAPVDSPEAKTDVANFCAAAVAASKLKRSRVGLVGYTSMSIYTGTFDHVFLRAKIGPEVEHIDNYTLINMAEDASEDDKRQVVEEYMQRASIHCEVSEAFLLKSAGLYLSMERLLEEKGLSAINLKCQYELSKEYKMVPCVPLSLIADKGVVASCEGDILNTVSMMMLHYLSGETVTYGDAINHFGNIVKLSSCGFVPFSMGESGKRLIRNFMPHPGFTGIQNSFTVRPGRVTLMRLVEDQCDYHILYCTGEGLETELRQGYMPAIDVRLDGDISELVKHYSGQHYAICFGDLSSKIEALAAILGIKTIRI